jgi:UDP-2,3-diacylglucosamine hydrolase
LRNKIYFASDQHFGAPNFESSLEREKVFVKWLDIIKEDAEQLFLLGDLFDFWYEYKSVVPRGYTRVLGKLAELSDSGIKISFFAGNHDQWLGDYLEKELGATIYFDPSEFNLQGKKFLIGHGDGLGPGDIGYKLMKWLFRNSVARWFFSRLHPNLAVSIARYFSQRSRLSTGDNDEVFLGKEKEQLIQFVEQNQAVNPYDYYVFGHRHYAIEYKLANGLYVNTGEWVKGRNYAVLENGILQLKKFEI